MEYIIIAVLLIVLFLVTLRKSNNQMETLLNKMSDFVILYCQNLGVSISPLKLQKLLYYIQSWHITKFEKDILFETMPEAWVNGPVYRPIYDKYKSTFFKNENFQNSLDEESLSKELSKKLETLNLSKDKQDLVFSVLNAYGKLSDEKLVLMTHSEEPWNEARQGLSPIERSEKKISIDTIFNYYNNRLTKK
ncbi:Panacea domain-containing protein [Flavobacterium columnare]|uniref:Panacea domain-containing protein n=1 Tax=Flavobacterium columnare TaxID=996 RepID=UPI0013D51087|nr:type II toxin-antitoxin system antitoxin SocA domain-containing protein [Flavobacterium columnare]